MSTLHDVKRPMLRGRPIAWIPTEARDYPDFLTWWRKIGRQHPTERRGWSMISGPGVMLDRAELIVDEAWETLPLTERELIETWIERLDAVLYD